MYVASQRHMRVWRLLTASAQDGENSRVRGLIRSCSRMPLERICRLPGASLFLPPVATWYKRKALAFFPPRARLLARVGAIKL